MDYATFRLSLNSLGLNFATQTTVPSPSWTPKLSKQVIKYRYSSCKISPRSIETSRNRLNSLRNENLNVNQAFLPFQNNLANRKRKHRDLPHSNQISPSFVPRSNSQLPFQNWLSTPKEEHKRSEGHSARALVWSNSGASPPYKRYEVPEDVLTFSFENVTGNTGRTDRTS